MRIYYARYDGKNGSAAVRRLLGIAVCDEFGIPLPGIEKTPGGKPFFPARPDIFFSLSHTKNHVLCAVSDCPVGADIETAARTVKAGLPERVCTPGELESFTFFELWTLKESFIKLTGGLLGNMRDITFSRGEGGEIAAPELDVSARVYTLGECIAAVCSRGVLPPEAPVEIALPAD